MDRAQLELWRAGYDAAGITDDSHPPAPLLQLAADAKHVIASDLERALRSAERLAPRREIRVSELLRESALAIPPWPTRLPLTIWNVFIHAGWQYQILRGLDVTPDDRARAAAAVDLLAGLVADGSTAVVVTHGVFRRIVAKALLASGWRNLERRGGYQHWSSWTFATDNAS
jgi:broad specificity phosphatase PhoE